MINKKHAHSILFNPMSIFTVIVTLISFTFFLAHLNEQTSNNAESEKRIEAKVDALTSIVIQLQQRIKQES